MMQAQERKHIPVASIQGRWIGKDCWVGENQESQKAIESMKIEFKGRKVSAWLNGVVLSGSFTTDEAKTPSWIDLRMKLDSEVVVVRGIYIINNNILKLCYPIGAGGKRPTGFTVARGITVDTYNKAVEK